LYVLRRLAGLLIKMLLAYFVLIKSLGRLLRKRPRP